VVGLPTHYFIVEYYINKIYIQCSKNEESEKKKSARESTYIIRRTMIQLNSTVIL